MTHPWPFKSIPGAHEGGTGDGPAYDAAYKQELLDSVGEALLLADRLRGLLQRAGDELRGAKAIGACGFDDLLADIDKELAR